MERKEIVRTITALGWRFSREGSNHEIWRHPDAQRFITLPRRNISPGVAKSILIYARKYVLN